MTDTANTAGDATRLLLDRFLGAVRPLLPLVAVWAHGSLGGGDYQEGRSDLDLIAVTERPCTADEERRLGAMHERLGRVLPLAAKLHCGYLAAESDDPARPHPTWAHQELFRRPVTPVTRRELHEFGLVLHGPAPADVLPPVTGEQLADHIVANLRDYWRPVLDPPERWAGDIWGDLGLLTLARAAVTLRDGSLITKAEALDVLAGLGAPAEVVADIRSRRYGSPGPAPEEWIARRAGLTLAFLRPALDDLVTRYSR